MKYLKMAGEWIVESLISAGIWLLSTVCILFICALMIVAGYFIVNMNCYVIGDMPMVCNMTDNQGFLKEIMDRMQ